MVISASVISGPVSLVWLGAGARLDACGPRTGLFWNNPPPRNVFSSSSAAALSALLATAAGGALRLPLAPAGPRRGPTPRSVRSSRAGGSNGGFIS